MDQVIENYQLKWHSFSSYLHSCVATSLQNESFADVALVTTDGHQIMAHRFVLSACSQYLHQVLKIHPKVTTALPLMIVLPPEINYKTLKILMQYMYSGEATVSKDILEFVLRGGDILKVKGLWRPKEDEPHDNKLVKVSHRGDSSNQATKEKLKPNSKASSISSNESQKERDTSEKTTSKSVEDETEEGGKKETNNEKLKLKIKTIHQNTVIRRTEDEKQAQEKESPKIHEENSNESTNDALQFLVIKEEPIEWSEVNDSEMELIDEKEMFTTEMTIKPEICIDESEDQPNEMYSPLTCELCTETFALPAEWVRHVQTHTDMLPAKRQRRGQSDSDDVNDAPFPVLHCDLCQKYFPTPAEWVHHIQNTHTEFELHLSNKSTSGKVIKQPRLLCPTHNTCTICSKKFPSHASLLIHRRTHTGEKPYICELCYKGFNVKSNLLRHLRTVHDKILNPTDLENSKEDSSAD